MTCQKHRELLKLAKLRQATRWDGYNCIGDYHNGVYECDFVSPYTKSASNVNADIMIMLQDWDSDDRMRGPVAWVELGYDPYYVTNVNLIRLLRTVFGAELKDTYATNLFPFIKMSADVAPGDYVAAAKLFGLRQAEIVEPKLVVCLGIATFDALREAAGLARCRTVAYAIDSPFDIGPSRVWCQAHTGQRGTNMRNRGGVDRVTPDWLTMKEAVGL